MSRLPDWEELLSGYLADNAARPFSWGDNDCILFACGAVEAMTGVDPAADYRGQYSDREGAALALREIGKGTLVKTMDATFKRKPVGMAQRGDIVMFRGAAGVCVGAVALFVGEEHLLDAVPVPPREGLVPIPRALWERAWAV
jgi:hypothetical protein